MKDEIKEILDRLNKIVPYANVPKELAYMTTNITPQECKLLLDYITNLKEKLVIAKNNEETYRLEMQDITKILGLNEHTTFDEVKEYTTNLQEENERLKEENKHIFSKVNDDELLISNAMNYAEAQGYKLRIEKAIEYIEENQDMSYYGAVINTKMEIILNILGGKNE